MRIAKFKKRSESKEHMSLMILYKRQRRALSLRSLRELILTASRSELKLESQCFVTIRSAKFWTRSSNDLSFSRYGDQIAEAYSRMGQTNDLYSYARVAGEVKL